MTRRRFNLFMLIGLMVVVFIFLSLALHHGNSVNIGSGGDNSSIEINQTNNP